MLHFLQQTAICLTTITAPLHLLLQTFVVVATIVVHPGNLLPPHHKRQRRRALRRTAVAGAVAALVVAALVVASAVAMDSTIYLLLDACMAHIAAIRGWLGLVTTLSTYLPTSLILPQQFNLSQKQMHIP